MSQNILTKPSQSGTLVANASDTVTVSRTELEIEERWLITRLQRVRKLQGKPPLMTGAHVRKMVRRAGK